MKGAGWKKITEFEWKGGKYPVQVNTGNGSFKIEVPTKDPTEPKRFVGKDLEELRKEVKAYFMQETEIKWEPVIHLFNDASRGDLDLKLTRYFKATLGDGKVIWRCDNGSYDKEPEINPNTLEGRDEPTRRGTFIPYDKESWRLLRNLERGIYLFHEIVDHGVREGNVVVLLEILLEGGIGLLAKNPKKWKVD